MKALTEFEQQTLDKSIEMLMKAIAESGTDLGKLLITMKKANAKLEASKIQTKRAA